MPTIRVTGTFEGSMEVPDWTPIPRPPDPGPNPEPPDPNQPFQLGDVPFAPSSSWNTKVPADAQFADVNWPPPSSDGGYNYTLTQDAYTPAIVVAAEGDPVVTVSHPLTWGWEEGTKEIRIASGVTGAPGTDGELLAIDGDQVHNLWQFTRTGEDSGTSAAYGVCNVKTDSGWGTKNPFKGAGIMAAGCSMLCGLLVRAETDKGVIQHALSLVGQDILMAPGEVGEAINSDGTAANGILQEAARYAIPRDTQMPSGLSSMGEMIFQCLQEYGCFATDVAGGCSKFRMELNAYPQEVVAETWPNMQKIIPLLKRVL